MEMDQSTVVSPAPIRTERLDANWCWASGGTGSASVTTIEYPTFILFDGSLRAPPDRPPTDPFSIDATRGALAKMIAALVAEQLHERPLWRLVSMTSTSACIAVR